MEQIAKTITMYASHGLEMLAAGVITIALFQAVHAFFVPAFVKGPIVPLLTIRLKFGNAVALALELLLGADVLATAVAPSWNDIGQLAAIAVIRTTLNYFLAKELKQVH